MLLLLLLSRIRGCYSVCDLYYQERCFRWATGLMAAEFALCLCVYGARARATERKHRSDLGEAVFVAYALCCLWV